MIPKDGNMWILHVSTLFSFPLPIEGSAGIMKSLIKDNKVSFNNVCNRKPFQICLLS